jgi:hypothetical protein
VKVADIHQGDRVAVRVVVPAGRRTPRFNARLDATVVDVAGAHDITIEVLETVCVNLAEIRPDGVAHAMINGRLRYEQRPRQLVVSAADIVTTSVAAEAAR